MKPFLVFGLISLTACTAPAPRSTGAASGGVAPQSSTGAVTQEHGAPYIDGLLTPVANDERTLHEQDLERIGRRP